MATGASMIDSDVLTEAQRLLAVAQTIDLPVRALGGAAIALRVGERMPPSLRRAIADIDLATPKRAGRQVEDFLLTVGYEPNQAFNSMNGARRLLFYDSRHGRQLDVFVGVFEMCHEIPLEARMLLEPRTLPLAELLLTKLQIRKLNAKDRNDLYALFSCCQVEDRDGEAINANRIAELCAEDWGLYRTTTINLDRLQEERVAVDLSEPERERLSTGLDRLRLVIEAHPKSRRWKLRARVGDRVRWYEDPEEVEHGGY